MKTKTEKILMGLKVLAWLAMFGYAVQFGSQLISFGVSFYNAEAAKTIYGTSLNLYDLHEYNLLYFIHVMAFVIALSAMNATVWYSMIRMLSNLNLKNPFSKGVATLLEKTGIQLLAIWVVSVTGEQWVHWVAKSSGLDIGRLHAVNEYLFIAGIVYIISQVFKRGIEIQEENQLTV